MLKLKKRKLIEKKLINDYGGMENILVAIFLVIVGVSGVFGLTSWVSDEKEGVQKTSSSKLISVVDELTDSP